MYNRHLDILMMVVEKGSFAKAAEALFISSTAVMKQINLLEDELGVVLFKRTNHGVELTEEGKSIYQDAKKIIRLSQQAIEKAKQMGQKTIRIGSSLMRPARTIMEIWAEIRTAYPSIQLEIVPFDDAHESYLRLLNHLGEDIDIVAGTFPTSLWNCQCRVLPLERMPIMIAAPLHHPLAQKKCLTWQDLDGQTLFVVEKGETEYVDYLREEIVKNHPLIHIQNVSSYDTKTFNACERSGSLMLSTQTWRDLHPSLVTIPMDWDFTIPYGVLYPMHPTPAVQTFLKALVNHHQNHE